MFTLSLKFSLNLDYIHSPPPLSNAPGNLQPIFILKIYLVKTTFINNSWVPSALYKYTKVFNHLLCYQQPPCGQIPKEQSFSTPFLAPVTISCPESISSCGGALGAPPPHPLWNFYQLGHLRINFAFCFSDIFLLLHWSFSNYRSWSQGVTECFPPSQLKYLHRKAKVAELSHFEEGRVCFLDSRRNRISVLEDKTSEVICSSPEATAFRSHGRVWSQGWEASKWQDRNQSRRDATFAVIQKSGEKII